MSVHHLNLVGYVCPVPLMQTKQKYKEISSGEELLIETEHPRAVRNIIDWAYKQGLIVDVDEKENGLWEISIKK